jgi:DNA-binding NarL/FixJ family response regulator
MKPIRILIADAHDIVRRSIRAALESEPTWIICGEAKTRLETLAKTVELLPDVVLLDIDLLGLNDVELTGEIHRIAPEVRVVVLTMHTSGELARRLYDAGAHGYVPKADVGRTLVGAIHSLIRDEGRAVQGPSVADPLVEAAEADRRAAGAFAALTAREREVMRLLAEGRSNKEIGSTLTISTKTVETHRARIMSKLHLRSINELVRYAIRHRIIPP